MNQDTGVTEWVHTTYDVDGGDWYAAANNAPSHPQQAIGTDQPSPSLRVKSSNMEWLGWEDTTASCVPLTISKFGPAAPCADATSGEMTVSNPPQHGTLEFDAATSDAPISIIITPHG